MALITQLLETLRMTVRRLEDEGGHSGALTGGGLGTILVVVLIVILILIIL
jgi:hypothetical protein